MRALQLLRLLVIHHVSNQAAAMTAKGDIFRLSMKIVAVSDVSLRYKHNQYVCLATVNGSLGCFVVRRGSCHQCDGA